MNLELTFAWGMLLMLGIFHGINPGMGWLFAVGLGLQEQQRSAVWRALLPLALGHALAVGAAVVVVLIVGVTIPTSILKWAVAAMLFLFGCYRLVRHRHPRFGGMQMRRRDLSIWSFLMATAHGAGLMVLPFVFGAVDQAAHHDGGHLHDHAVPVAHSQLVDAAGHASHTDQAVHAAHAAGLLEQLPAEPVIGLLVTLVHTIGYLAVMGLIAVVVYEKLGLRILRTAWVNLDLIWAAVLIVTAILTPLV